MSSMKKNNYMTPDCQKKLLAELDHLSRTERPEVTRLVQWAASNGDRSENADYLYGKRRLREIDRRIRFLTQRLDAAVIVDPTKIQSQKVQFGATVRLSDEEGKSRIVSIVGVDEVETEKGKLSWQSPIGRALLTKEIGDEITVRTPQGDVLYTIEALTYGPIP